MTHQVDIADTLWDDAKQFGHPPAVIREAVRLGLKQIEERQPQSKAPQRPTVLPALSMKNRWTSLGVIRNRALDPKLYNAVDNLIEAAGSEDEALCYLEAQKNVGSMTALIIDRWGKKGA